MESESSDEGGDSDGSSGICVLSNLPNIPTTNYRKHDAIAVYNLHKRIFAYSKETLPSVGELRKMQGYLIKSKNEIMGYLLFTKYDNKSIDYYLDYVGVNPKFQGRGIGQALMNRFVEYLDANNYTCALHVEENTVLTKHLTKWYNKNQFNVLKKGIKTEVFLTLMVRMPDLPITKHITTHTFHNHPNNSTVSTLTPIRALS